MQDINESIKTIAGFMQIAATTAPKTRGINNIITKILKDDEVIKLADDMINTGKKTQRPHTFQRDSDSIRSCTCIFIAGTLKKSLGLDCSFCGYSDCRHADQNSILCSYNSCDLGIAIGSAVATANRFHIDNRIMYTIGYTAVRTNIFDEQVSMALGVPLSATGKNPFFDRR
ncbi:DUF2148 domain-containing protein [Elusimicrobiota bacterium]